MKAERLTAPTQALLKLAGTREIRALERKQGLLPTTIIALTGLASTKTEQEAFASGANLFLTKPVQLKKTEGRSTFRR
jgi:CheY-like chemotaxis protein